MRRAPGPRPSRVRRLVRRLSALTALALVLTGVTVAGTATADAAGGADPGAAPRAVLPADTTGPEALARLDADALAQVAALNETSVPRLRTILATDSTARLGRSGRLRYQDPVNARAKAAPPPVARGPFPNASTFLLHSRPGSKRTLYLDFDGYDLPAGTGWSKGAALTALPYDTDGNPAVFGQAEIDTIQSIWQRVSEDYAIFDIDVTTEKPAPATLRRDSATDDVYGGNVVITNTPNASQCDPGCSGVAYVGTLDAVGPDWDFHQPAWVFPDGSGPGAAAITYPTSHEFGHTMGLSHDGQTNGTEYYGGHGSWAPIMGVTFGQPVSQWSKGEYALANNTEDDFVVAGANGVALLPDETGGGVSPNRELVPGRTRLVGATPAGDIDTWRYVAPCTGSYVLSANPAAVSPNLSVVFQVYTFGGALLAQDAGQPTQTSSDSMAGMGGSVTLTLTAGQAYTLGVLPLPNGTASTGWTNYGNVGNYSISVVRPAGCTVAPNDVFEVPEVLGGTVATSATTSNATAGKEIGEPAHAGNAGGRSLWYAWTAPGTGLLSLSTCASTVDTTLGVYTGATVDALTQVAANDDSAVCGTRATLRTPVTAGTTYRIAVDGFNGAAGNLALSLTFGPANDAYADRQVVAGQSGSLTGSNAFGTLEGGEPTATANGGGSSVWYSYTPVGDGRLQVATCGAATTFDTLLGVYTGSALTTLTRIGGDDDGCNPASVVTVDVQGGTEYALQVDGFNAARGSFALNWSWTPTVRVGDVGIVEGDTGTRTAAVPVRLSAPSTGPVTLTWSTSPGTAISTKPADFTAQTGRTLTIPAGATSATLAVPVLGDARGEPTESLTVTATAVTGAVLADATGTVTIVDDDAFGSTPVVRVGDATVVEGNGGTSVATFDVTLDQASSSPVTVPWSMLAGTATAPADYNNASGTLTFPAGTTSVKTNITVKGDALDEADETAQLVLGVPSGAVVGDGSGLLTVLDDDPGTVNTVSIGDVVVSEGDTTAHAATFTARLRQAVAVPTTVQYTTAGGGGTATAGSDFVAKTGTLTIPAGAVSASLPVTVNPDGAVEPSETVTVTLSSPTGGPVLGRSVGTATIQDDDPNVARTLGVGLVSAAEGDAGAGSASAVVTLNRPSPSAVTLQLATTDVTTSAGSDYVTVNQVVTIPANTLSVLVAIPLLPDNAVEPDETFTITLSPLSGAVVGVASATGTILTDD